MNNPNDVKDNEMLENHESNKSVTNHKIKMTVLISLNAVLLIALLIVATFTWIPSTIIEADRINYTNDLIVSSNTFIPRSSDALIHKTLQFFS